MNTIYETNLLTRASEIISFAEYLPIEMITVRNTEPKYPVTIGELLVNYALDIVIRQGEDWASKEHEYNAELLMELLSTLDMGVDKPDVWQKLFEANREVAEFLKNL